MITSPLVSVLMPVYNAEKYLAEAIESILNQSYTNFEFLIFNDGSTDASAEIVNQYPDERIRFIHIPENIGYVPHLNAGIEMARGKYIARMDADDISHPQRLEKQVAFLETNPAIGLVGTAVNIFSANGPIYTWVPEQAHEAAKCYLLFDTCFAHPSVMLRREVLLRQHLRYDATYMPAEDYKFWASMVQVCQVANLAEALLNYRESDTQISQQKSQVQFSNANRVRQEMLSYLGITPTPAQLNIHAKVLDNYWPPQESYFNQVKEWFYFLLQSNSATRFYEQEELGKLLGKLFFQHCQKHTSLNFNAYNIFQQSGLNRYYQPPTAALLKLKLAPYYRLITPYFRRKSLLGKQ